METPIVPNITGLTELVYEPAEDSFLLLDALEEDLPSFLKAKANQAPDVLFTLEVGCGSGIISTAVAKSESILNGHSPFVFAADINPNACLLTRKTAEENKVNGSSIETLLLDGTKSSIISPFRIKFDLILCNPPYVPIQPGENDEDERSGMLQHSWDGGPDGNQFIIPFLSKISAHLKDDGLLYMLLSSWNNPEMLAEKVALPNGLQGEEVMKRVAGRERLFVWKFHKTAS